MKSPSSPGKPTLESLLRVKRAERPEPEFWQQFESELRRRQLAATIEPKPWWLGFAALSRKAAPFGMPVGAAAALALAAVVYQTGNWTTVEAPAYIPVVASNNSVQNVSQVVATVADNSDRVDVKSMAAAPVETIEAPVLVASTESANPELGNNEKISPVVSEYIPELQDTAFASLSAGLQQDELVGMDAIEQSPSKHYIAYNLATARSNNPELLSTAGMNLSLSSTGDDQAASSPVLAAAPVNQEPEKVEVTPRNARLLALVNATPQTESAVVSANIAREQAVRLNDDVLYASANRLGLGGDRLSISF